MSGGCSKLDLDSILLGYGFLTKLPSGDLLNFGNTCNNHLPVSNFGKQFTFGLDWEGMFFKIGFVENKEWGILFHLS